MKEIDKELTKFDQQEAMDMLHQSDMPESGMSSMNQNDTQDTNQGAVESDDENSLQQLIVEQLKTIYDPEIPINIYDLGLIYQVNINQGAVAIDMTLTSPGCPVAATFPGTVEASVREVEGVESVEVELVWDPPWTVDLLSEEAKLELGLL